MIVFAAAVAPSTGGVLGRDPLPPSVSSRPAEVVQGVGTEADPSRPRHLSEVTP